MNISTEVRTIRTYRYLSTFNRIGEGERKRKERGGSKEASKQEASKTLPYQKKKQHRISRGRGREIDIIEKKRKTKRKRKEKKKKKKKEKNYKLNLIHKVPYRPERRRRSRRKKEREKKHLYTVQYVISK